MYIYFENACKQKTKKIIVQKNNQKLQAYIIALKKTFC